MINYIEKGIGLHDLIRESGYTLSNTDGQWVSSNDEAVQAIIDNYDPIPQARLDAKERIRKQLEDEMLAIELAYPRFEVLTWAYQRLEVEAWELDNTAPTPTIDAIALSSGIDRITQLNKTAINVNAYKNASNHLAGLRQKLFREIDGINDYNTLQAISVVI